MSERLYEGQELELFESATNWKATVARELAPYVGGDVLEVGAGLGGTTRALSALPHQSWLCLEPDPRLLEAIRARLEAGELPATVAPQQGSLAELDAGQSFDTILYLDVLEHIPDDRAELTAAGRLLRPGGRLVVLSPAHPFLWSTFDTAIGHHRRYQRATLTRLAPPGLTLVTARYLDSAGMLASLLNRLVLKKREPTRAQIRLWDSVLVRCSRVLDRLTLHRLGKSILAVWRKG